MPRRRRITFVREPRPPQTGRRVRIAVFSATGAFGIVCSTALVAMACIPGAWEAPNWASASGVPAAYDRQVPHGVVRAAEAPQESAAPSASSAGSADPSAPSTASSTASAAPSAAASSAPRATSGAIAQRPAVVPGDGGGTVQYGTVEHPFAADSPWNTPIAAGTASDPSSDAIVKNVLANPNLVMNLNVYSFGLNFYTATSSTPRARLNGPVPKDAVPLDPSWRPNDGADHKINVFDPTTGSVYEIDSWNPDANSAKWFVKRDYRTGLGDGVAPESAGPTGSGLSQVGGIIKLSDIRSGSIDHALEFITSNPVAGTFRYPATHTDGEYHGSAGVEEGMRIQLDPTLDVDALPGITPAEKMVAKALQRYGAYCVDTGRGNNQAMGFYAENPNGKADPYPSVGVGSDWSQLPHIPRDRIRVVAATPQPHR